MNEIPYLFWTFLILLQWLRYRYSIKFLEFSDEAIIEINELGQSETTIIIIMTCISHTENGVDYND